MKKVLSLALLLMTSFGVSAQEVRKLWNFDKGFSQTTLDNLAGDTEGWTDQSSKGFFEGKKRAAAGQLTCKVNGEDWVIPETAGLVFGYVSNQHINIQFESAALGPHVWLNGKKAEDCVTIPQVPAGEKITITYSSHKDTEARGFEIKTAGVVSAEDNTTTKFTTKGKETVVIINNNSEAVDVKLQATNGMHFHYICVGDEPQEEEQKTKIAYLYDSSYPGYDISTDAIHEAIGATITDKISDAEFVDIDISTTQKVDLDSLRKIDVVVISNAINPATPYVNTIKSAIAYVPMLNLSTTLYETWGYGKAAQGEDNILKIAAKAQEAPIFFDEMGESILDEGTIALYYETPVAGYTAEEGSYFAKDSVWATTSNGVNAIHVHNGDRNAYMMLPTVFGKDADGSGVLETMVPASIAMLYGTKRELQNTARPSITQTFHHLMTTVSLKSSTKGAVIYYTTDGTEPTMESPVYTEPFDINTTGVTVKAIAMADGYFLSDVANMEIAIHELADAPSISVVENDGASEITLVPAHEGDVILYNFTGSNLATASSTYEGPITVTKHTTITAMTAEQGNYLQSEIVSQFVNVKNEKVRMDVVSHMDAAKDDWPNGYFNTKNGHAYYSDIVSGTDAEGNTTYEPANELININPLKGWEVSTLSQVMLWQNNNPTHNVGNGDGYNPERAIDDSKEATSNCISFGKNGPANSDGVAGPDFTGWIQSTEAFQGPFDLVSFIATSGSSAVDVFAYVTTDTLSGNWTELGKLETGTVKRLWKQTVLGYEGTDKVFVKICGKNGACVFDLYIKNEGELSKEYITGIQNVNAGKAAEGEVIRTMVYSLNGTQLDKAGKGINIIKEVYANGAVKAKKVMIK